MRFFALLTVYTGRFYLQNIRHPLGQQGNARPNRNPVSDSTWVANADCEAWQTNRDL
jgi:hypothetical protein